MRHLSRHRFKFLGVLSVLSIIMISVSVMIGTGNLILAILSFLGSGCFIFLILVSSWTQHRQAVRIDRRLTAAMQETKKTRIDASAVAYRTRDLRASLEKLSQIKRNIEILKKAADELKTSASLEAQETSSDFVVPGAAAGINPFNPSLIATYSSQGQSGESVKAGRGAAAKLDDPASSQKYRMLLEQPLRDTDERPIIAAIATQALRDDMSVFGNVVGLRPDSGLNTLPVAAAYLVVEDSAFESGPWFGADSAEGTELFLMLSEILKLAKSRGILTVMVARSGVANHYTRELEHRHRIILRPQPNNDDGAVTYTTVVHSISDCVFSRGADR